MKSGIDVSRGSSLMGIYEQELLSVIVPIYNVEKYLPRCLDSIINQTYRNLEIICVDDGSTDQSGMVADEYARKDNRVKVIHKENGGIVSARKRGTEIATGSYITNVDSDDYIELNMYHQLMPKIVNCDADAITSGLIRDYGNHLIRENENIKPGVYEGHILREEVLSNLIDTKCFFRANISLHITNKIFKTDSLKKYQMQVADCINVGDDVAVWFPYFINHNRIIVSGENYYHYCVRNDSVMGVKGKNDLESLNLYFMYLYDEIKKIQYKNNYDSQIMFLKIYNYLLRDAFKILKIKENELYPFGNIGKKQSIVLYGAGKFGAELKHYLDSNGFNVVAWVDKSRNREEVVTLTDILDLEFDAIIIGTLVSDATKQIKKELIESGISENIIYSISEKSLIMNS